MCSRRPALLQIKDTINEMSFYKDVFNCLLKYSITAVKRFSDDKENKRFLCVWLLYYVNIFFRFTNVGPKISIKPYFVEIISFPQCIQQQ